MNYARFRKSGHICNHHVMCLAQSNVFDRLRSRFHLPVFDDPFRYLIIDKLSYATATFVSEAFHFVINVQLL